MYRFPITLAVAAALLTGMVRAQPTNQKDLKDYNGALGTLKTGNATDRAAALSMLALMGTEAKGASRQVIGALFDSSPEVRKWAGNCIKQVNPPLADPVLTMTQGRNYDDRVAAMQRLAKLGDAGAAAVPALLVFIRDAQPEDRVKAIATLSSVGTKDPSVAEALAKLAVADPDPAVRKAALGALPKQQDNLSALAYLGKLAASDVAPNQRIAALAVLGDIGKGNPQVQKVLEDVMRSNSTAAVKAAAKQALEKTKRK